MYTTSIHVVFMYTKIVSSIFSKAAMVIQAQWHSNITHRDINCSEKMHPTTTEPLHDPVINNQTTSNEERRKTNMNIQEQREKAALHIQVNSNF